MKMIRLILEAWVPILLLNHNELLKKIISKIETNIIGIKEKIILILVLYVGLMIKNNEPYLIEYNIRMGDPECQVILPRLKTDLVSIIQSTISNKLKDIKIRWLKEKSMTIVMCAKGYPGNYRKNLKIKNINKIKLSKNDYIYHAGTRIKNNEVLSNGGRVLNITSIGSNFLKIRNNIFSIIRRLNWKKRFL